MIQLTKVTTPQSQLLGLQVAGWGKRPLCSVQQPEQRAEVLYPLLLAWQEISSDIKAIKMEGHQDAKGTGEQDVWGKADRNGFV